MDIAISRNKNISINTRIISWFIVLLLTIGFCCCPVLADTPLLPGEVVGPGGVILEVTGFADYNLSLTEQAYTGAVNKIDWLIHGFSEDVCTSGYSVNGKHNFVAQHTSIDGNTGYYYVCQYCGKSAGEVAQSVQADYVDSLPASGVDSGGAFVWSVTVDDITQFTFFDGATATSTSYQITKNSMPYMGEYTSYAIGDSGHSVSIAAVFNNSSRYLGFVSVKLRLPVTGQYSRMATANIAGSYDTYDGTNVPYYFAFDRDSSFSGTQGQIWSCGYNYIQIRCVYGHFVHTFPVYRVVPSAGLVDVTSTGTTYNIDSRPTTIEGDLAYYNTNGDLTLSTGNSIVNETNSTVYNPVTDTTYNMTDWSYDYSDRSYTITTDAGDTVSVTYGDENITINEGGTTYNVYYVMEQQTPEPSPHVHSYTGTVTTQPTCTVSGVKTYACSECNDTYTEAVPALGHDWQIKSQVQTTYDEQGQLTQQGYTIYRCSRCGEEYRTDDSVNPSPPVTTETPQGDLVEVNIPSGLERLRDKILLFFTTLPEMFRAVTDFLKDAFAYVPEEILYLIEFGVAMAVLVALLKMLWR